MSDYDNHMPSAVSTEDAIENYIGEQFLVWLLSYISTEVKSWPELAGIRAAHPKIEKIRKFMLQRYLAASAFMGGRDGDPGFLGFAIANLSESPDPMAEGPLGILEQKKEEEVGSAGSGKNTHHELWLNLFKALEVPSDEISKAETKESTRNYVAELSDLYSTAEWQSTMGAFLAHEKAIADEYAALAEMLKQNTSVAGNALEVLKWSGESENKYVTNTSHILEKTMVDPESKQFVLEGVDRQLAASKEFYGQMLKYLES